MARKFEDGEIAIIGDNIPDFERRHYQLYPGTEVVIMGVSSCCTGYTISTPNGNRKDVYTKYLVKKDPVTSIQKFQDLIEQATEKIAKTKAFIAETEAKINFMKEVGTDTFDENEFKAFHTLTIIEQGNMSKIEKAKAIAALISQK
jgi:hypothetical protein